MDEIAQVVGACELDPYLVRSGKQGLFELPHYDNVFDGRPVQDYLSCYWLGKVVKAQGSGYPDRAYAKWHAMHFLWSQAGPTLRKRRAADEFRRLCEIRQPPVGLQRAANEVFRALADFFRLNRGTGHSAIDISNFFYKPHQDREFKKYWKSRRNSRKQKFNRHLSSFQNAVQHHQ